MLLRYPGRALLLLLLTLASCRTTEEGNSLLGERGDLTLERIDKLLDAGEHLRVIPLILAQTQEGKVLPGRYDKALEGLTAGWEASREEGDWRRSLSYLRSFKTLGKEGPWDQVSETELFRDGARHYIKEGQPGAAAALMQSEIDLSQLSSQDLEYLRAAFEEGGLTAARDDVIRAQKGVPQEESPSLANIIDGTVTVWVNRGIRLVRGVGIPDRGIGSGFYIDSSGYLLTNYHVIQSEVDPAYQGYSRLYIKEDEESGERTPVKVISWDKNFDIALLKTELPVPYTFSFASRDIPELGEKVFAIGSPGGLGKTLTSGTVSAYARSIQPLAGSLQIDAPINPGNSGGPLLNSRGEVIGVVFAGIEQFEGVNFAIPGPYVRGLIPQLFDEGPLVHPWIGAVGWDNTKSLEILYVVPGSPAAEGGLQEGDHIETVDGRPAGTIRELQAYLLRRGLGTLTKFTWRRGEERMEGLISLGARPEEPMNYALARDARENLLTPLFGMKLDRVKGYGFYKTYRVTKVYPGTIADEAGFSMGDTVSFRRWIHDEEYDVVAIQLLLRGRKAGFLENVVQIATLLNINTVF